MPVDQATLDRYITDVAGDDQDLAKMLREQIGSKPEAATRFVGGFTRTQDYTQKTQALAADKQKFEAAQVDYEARITQADAEKDRIMRDLANERISASRATALLKTVKEAYGLTDNDLPGIDDIKQTQQQGRVVDSTPDIDERLKSFKQDILSEINKVLIPEISGLAKIPTIWNHIEREHQQLFGKPLSQKESDDILSEASKKNQSLVSVWQDRYSVADKRLEVRDEGNKSKWRQEWEDEQAKKNQELALQGVRPGTEDEFLRERQSPIFRKNFMPQDAEGDSGNTSSNNGNTSKQAPPVHNDAERERLGGAERAAAKFMERRRNGIPFGQPETRKAS
jgi:hypothetical protein